MTESNVTVDLIWQGQRDEAPAWPLGAVHTIEPTVADLHRVTADFAPTTTADAWLFWHSDLGPPDAEIIAKTLQGPGQCFHAGLVLGTAGLPGTLDFVAPTWMLNSDPAPNIEATSWRLSLAACLAKTDVIQTLGTVNPAFSSVVGAGLDMGLRYVQRGVLIRHVPALLPAAAHLSEQATLPLADDLRFIQQNYAKHQLLWTLGRVVLSGYAPPWAVIAGWRAIGGFGSRMSQATYAAATIAPDDVYDASARVAVLIPTIDRYPYLRTLLAQLREQQHPPHQIVVIDQTPPEVRDMAIDTEFDDLPLIYLRQDEPGQCSSRNAGLARISSDYILFLDDDDEVQPDLIVRHLQNLHRHGAVVSNGGQDEPEGGPPPPNFRHTQVSSIFPTNNTLMQRDILAQTGLFDLAYNKGQQADGDLGMRVYHSGQLMVFEPTVRVFHHHAPRGGLRIHGARVVTRAMSRASLFRRRLPHVTELYLAKRYFSPRQLREYCWLVVRGTMVSHQGVGHRVLRLGAGLLMLPNTLLELRRRTQTAEAMLQDYPQIPQLQPSSQDTTL